MSRPARESQLLDIAETMFAEAGYQDVTMEDIAERAGITKPVIYDHFGSKQGLLSAVMSRAEAELRDVTVRTIAEAVADGLEPEAAIRRTLHSFFVFIAGHRGSFALIQQEAVLGEPVLQGLQRIRGTQSELVVGFLRATPGGARRSEVELAALTEGLIGACERMAAFQVGHDEIGVDRATDLVMDLVWSGLATLAQD